MMVTFVSQCEKKSLPKTRRVLDAFANRIGNHTWQTVITNEGLQAVKKLLRKTASKNTAVSCHWIRSRSRSELLWVVGNKDKFNAEGVVPVNYTEKDLHLNEQFSLNAQVIALLSSLAGLFHDIGKATVLFQEKLDPRKKAKGFEPYRHEWVSLRIFQAFVNDSNDKQWLDRLINIDNQAEIEMLKNLELIKDNGTNKPDNPLKVLPPIARLVAWLIVSHHKLPQYPKKETNPLSFDNMHEWLDKLFEPSWITPQCLNEGWVVEDIVKNWTFPSGTPLKSAMWQTQASELAKKIVRHERMFLQSWFNQRYTAHISRLCLMLADHYYSSDVKINPEWQDRNYQAYANTYKDDDGHKKYKQKLDEHNIVVGKTAYEIAKKMPDLRSQLPALKKNKAFTAPVPSKFKADYGWQDKAFELAKEIKEDTTKYGFFGVCQASTGKGKTRANARIMYGLSEEYSCRFSIALGLRTLTLQTGDALSNDLKLKNEMAVLIGSQAVKDLHSQSKNLEISEEERDGSESAESLLKDQISLIENLPEITGGFSEWLEHDPKILKLIQAPILVSTIDYLMPATEGIRGGRQIAPMLRLLTSDLVLDEPDDFGLADLPALCRLVNWAGMLGSRVLLSTATIPPILASTLFTAYQEGRKHYTEVNGELGVTAKVCCAWFDEFKKPQTAILDMVENYEAKHLSFVEKRLKKLEEETLPLRKPKFIPIQKETDKSPSNTMASVIRNSIEALHQDHSVSVDNKKVSIGLVRMANINPMVQIAKNLLAEKAPDDTLIHYCIYHSQFSLLQRSNIEKQLDNALTRKNEKKWLKDSGIPKLIAKHKEKNHIFVVLATPVAEVGRDHDYDWAVVEPSSMRSIIQLAGRIQRHRKSIPSSENIHVLSKNYKGLKEGNSPCFVKPGFETEALHYYSKDLCDLIKTEEFKEINATPRIKTPSNWDLTTENPPRFKSFNGLEHLAQTIRLIGSTKDQNHASHWWQNNPTWCGELQSLQPFRESKPSDDFRLELTHNEKLRWKKKIEKSFPIQYELTDDIERNPEDIKLGGGNVFWSQFDVMEEVSSMAKKINEKEKVVLSKFSHLSLTKLDATNDITWQDHPVLGIYKILKNDEYEND